jgi:hypothetical protein
MSSPVRPCTENRSGHQIQVKLSPSTLIHHVTEEQVVCAIGVYSENDDGRANSLTPLPAPLGYKQPFYAACWPPAPLSSVHRAGVYYDDQTEFCVGILLEYENGSQRTVGQCRINVHPIEYYTFVSSSRFTHYRVCRGIWSDSSQDHK